jgi:type I restriction enzyme M protein
VRYAHLLEGLEISIIPFASLNLRDRADAEYFSKENRAIEKSLKDHKSRPLREFGTLVGSAFYPAATNLYEQGDIPFARCVDCIQHPVITRQQDSDFVRVPSWFVEQSQQIDSAKRGDIIITKVGTPCFASIVRDYDQIALSRTVLGLVRIHDIDPYYLVAFLRCRFGFNQLLRQREQTIQFQLTLDRVRQVLVFSASPTLQSAIKLKMLDHVTAMEQSHSKWGEAEAILCDALGLAGWNPPEPLSYTRRASEASAASRLDAEHFRPKFAALLEKMLLHGKVVRLGDNLHFCERGRQPHYADEGLPVVNSRHVREGTVVLGSQNRFANEEAAQLRLAVEERTTIKQGDVLMNGTGVGTMGRCAAYLYDYNSLPDNHITILRPTIDSGLDPVFLAAQLNSMIGQMQVEQYFKGSSGQIELYPAEIKEFRIWLAPHDVQLNIREAIESAHKAYEQAQVALDRAKRAIEIAIEDSEIVALRYLRMSDHA